MNAISGIVAFFKALPALIELLNRLGTVLERLMNRADTEKLNNWITELEHSVDKLDKAKTADEKLSAAKSLIDVIHGLSANPK